MVTIETEPGGEGPLPGTAAGSGEGRSALSGVAVSTAGTGRVEDGAGIGAARRAPSGGDLTGRQAAGIALLRRRVGGGALVGLRRRRARQTNAGRSGGRDLRRIRCGDGHGRDGDDRIDGCEFRSRDHGRVDRRRGRRRDDRVGRGAAGVTGGPARGRRWPSAPAGGSVTGAPPPPADIVLSCRVRSPPKPSRRTAASAQRDRPPPAVFGQGREPDRAKARRGRRRRCRASGRSRADPPRAPAASSPTPAP